MNWKFLLLVWILFFTSIDGCKSQSGKEMKSPIQTQTDVRYFRIVIINYFYGRVQYITTVTQDSLETLEDDLNGKQTRETRALRNDETEKLKTYLAEFPLTTLEDKYVNDRVKDGTQIGFDISINDERKRIYVANYYHNELGKLVELIRPMLKNDYIGYRKEEL